jgi:PhnB protein
VIRPDHGIGADAMRSGNGKSDFKPHGWHTITPRLVVPDARDLVRFVKDVFGATGDYQADMPAILLIGDSRIMISDAGVRHATTAFLYVYVADTDEVHRRAVQSGARSLEEPIDVPYGDRRAMIEDRWENTWQIATRLKRGQE